VTALQDYFAEVDWHEMGALYSGETFDGIGAGEPLDVAKTGGLLSAGFLGGETENCRFVPKPVVCYNLRLR
jgi:hypothetical protein